MARERTPMVVRAERTVGRTTNGGWQPALDARTRAVERAVGTLLEPALESLRGVDEIVVVPDAHYPYHPSSGVVTDPAVVGSVLAQLDRETSADLSVAGSSAEYGSFERAATYLGYPAAIEGSGASLLDLSSAKASRVQVSVPGGESDAEKPTSQTERTDETGITVSVPDPLLDAAVVVVPSLRPSRDGPIAGAMWTLGRHAEPDERAEPSTQDSTTSMSHRHVAWAATEAIDPDLALLDATTVFAGEPYASGTLLAGEPRAVDAVGTELLGRSIGDDEALALALGADGASIRIDGVDFDELQAELPSGDLPPADGVHPAVSAAYGVYARIAGDAVPPQLEVDR